MGKIIEFVRQTFEDHRNDKITLQKLILRLCGYADTNIRSPQNIGIFEDAVNKEFDSEGNISQ